ncbi:MAG: hypothetical protein RLZZ50_1754, partial [Verrucomicrobiota bacterium]
MIKRLAALFTSVCIVAVRATAPDAGHSHSLWYDEPAVHWAEALPVGNGRMGAMVFGGVTTERIQFNEQTLWTGVSSSQKLFGHNIGDGAMGDYQPFGDVFLRFPAAPTGTFTDYRRDLDLRTAVTTTRYKAGETIFTRKVFASHPDRVVVIRLTADRPASLSFDVSLKDVKRRQLAPVATTADAAARQLTFAGRLSRPPGVPATDLRWNDMAFQASLRVQPEGGKVVAASGGDSLSVVGADAVTILLAAATDYDLDPRKKFRGEAPAPKVAAALDRVSQKPYARLLADHVADHQSLYNRVSLDLGDHARDAIPTDQRLKDYKAGATDRSLEALLFHYGRYLSIASVRPGGIPANLQGLWNDNPAPAW